MHVLRVKVEQVVESGQQINSLQVLLARNEAVLC